MKIQRISGIQKKYLINIVLLLALALLLSSVGVGIYVRKNMSNVVLDKYEFMTEKWALPLTVYIRKAKRLLPSALLTKLFRKACRRQNWSWGEKCPE